MSKPNVLVVGFGTVGHNLYKELWTSEGPLAVSIFDKYKRMTSNLQDHYDLAFICVDTPFTIDTTCDISEVVCGINEHDADVYVIKSTVLPSQTDFLMQLSTEKHIVFSPEYYGATPHCTNFDFNFTLLGGNKKDCIKVQQILQLIYDASHQFKITNAKTACLAKYMENAYLATKVSFCNQFYDIAESIGIDYEELRELFILDPRVNPSHTFVYRNHPYWDSHCLNKDVRAIAEECDAEFLKSVISFNEKRKINE